MKHPRLIVLTLMVAAAVALRLVPHPPNFTPIAGLALFAGASFASRRLAFFMPVCAMLLSDALLGFTTMTPVIYGCFALIVALGRSLQKRRSIWTIAGASVAGSALFFFITNFAVWLSGSLYARTAAGLGECYIAAIPFFQSSLLGDLFYSALLFGTLALGERRWPALSNPIPAPAAV